MIDIPTVTLNNGVMMPQLGLGVYAIPNGRTVTSVTAALESGYRLIDTAAMYQNEAGVGEAIRSSNIPREDIFVTSKLWNTDHGYDNALAGFEASLKKLNMEYIDLYLIHWPCPQTGQIVETWKAFEHLYKEGRIKAIGVSNFKPVHLERLLQQAEIVPAVLQIEIHPTFTQAESRRYAAKHGIQVESWYPLGGRTTGSEMLRLPLLDKLATKYGKTAAQIVLRWHTQLGLVPLPGSSNSKHIEENRAIFDFMLLDDEIAAVSACNTDERLGPDPDLFNRR